LEHSKLISCTAAATLAAAIYDVFPGSELLGGSDTSTGFFYQFFSSYPLPPEAKQMLEEQMRQIVRENRPIREMEMVACSAREFFGKQGHAAAVNTIEELEPKELVSIVKIGDFSNLMDGPFCSTVRDVGAFKITALKSLGDCEYRVEGTAFATKEQLKKFLRLFGDYETGNHLFLGTELGLWDLENEHIVWTARGLATREKLLSLIQKSLGTEEYKASSLAVLDSYGLKRAKKGEPFTAWNVAEKTADPEGNEGFFEDVAQTIVSQSIYCEEGEIVELATSLLQRIRKTLIILGFDPHLRLAGRRQGEKGVKLLSYLLSSAGLEDSPVPFEVEENDSSRGAKIRWMISDGLRRMHAAIDLEVEHKYNGLAILRVKSGLERIFSLLLELNGGNLPSWLIPEHVRVLLINEQYASYGKSLCDAVAKSGYRAAVDSRELPLKQKLAEAKKEKLPFVAVIGDRELEMSTVSLRSCRFGAGLDFTSPSESVTLDELIERMNRTFTVEN